MYYLQSNLLIIILPIFYNLTYVLFTILPMYYLQSYLLFPILPMYYLQSYLYSCFCCFSGHAGNNLPHNSLQLTSGEDSGREADPTR
jgi:hypothetical protein